MNTPPPTDPDDHGVTSPAPRWRGRTVRRRLLASILIGMVAVARNGAGQEDAMSEAYRTIWNAAEQARIDREIDRHRKADAVLNLPGIPAGTVVRIEQLSHDFFFGANIFNFDQLGRDEYNERYKELFGTLFNSATIAFYWKTFELEPGKPRFKGEYRDTAEYWNQVEDPKNEPHWRRPASDPVVEFCEARGLRRHGHTICWGSRKWQHPDWMFETYCPDDEKQALLKQGANELRRMSPEKIAQLAPTYLKEMERLFDQRITELAERYQGRLHGWDIVNESATDFGQGRMIPGAPVCSSHYGLMPGDYTYRTFRLADRLFPKGVRLDINDYVIDQQYVDQVKDLLARGCRIDAMGSQMHLFNPQDCLDVADGKPVKRRINSPQEIRDTMALLAQAGLPIHLSEITITSPGGDDRGRAIQAALTRNLYRTWFSIEPMIGITWWNIVDDCGAPGEPTISGLFTRDMQPKPAYFALNRLINEEWKTRVTTRTDATGAARFRGFKGNYRATYTNAAGIEATLLFRLSKDGDGIPPMP